MENGIRRFNLRVYGLLIEEESILLCTETLRGVTFTKFPGGGLEYGEGLHAGLEREFLEELNLPIQIHKHYYTTDFFLESAFKKGDQLISVYYEVSRANRNPLPEEVKISEEEILRFWWQPLHLLHPDDFTFPIDKRVAALINEHGI